jgi:hypothetical protein
MEKKLKYFFSAIRSSGPGLGLGIPVDAAASLVYFSGEPRGPVEDDGAEQRFFIPQFFGFSGEEIRHGIVLKGEGRRQVLLVSSVEREIEFPPGRVYAPPAILKALGVYGFLAGLCFITDSGAPDPGDSLPLLLIDPFKLVAEMLCREAGRAA